MCPQILSLSTQIVTALFHSHKFPVLFFLVFYAFVIKIQRYHRNLLVLMLCHCHTRQYVFPDIVSFNTGSTPIIIAFACNISLEVRFKFQQLNEKKDIQLRKILIPL